MKLGTAAVILPWNDPLRVAEKIIMLDILSGGRALFGMGRGLSRMEFAPFGIELSESRGRAHSCGRARPGRSAAVCTVSPDRRTQ